MSKAGWTSPNEPWNKHPRPMARTALQAARKAGWWLNKSNAGAKVWGMITCGDPDLPGDERCRTIVHSTSGSSDGSETAEFIDNVVRKCPHDWATPEVADAFADAEKLITDAGRCLDAACSLIDARGHRDLVEDYLARSEAAANEADDLLDQAITEDELAKAAEAAASGAATASGTSTSLGPTGLAERARDQAGEARDLVADDSSREARMLKNRCEDIRNQARALLVELQ